MFSTLIDHLKAIHRACIKERGISGRQMGFYVGATTKAEKAAARAREGEADPVRHLRDDERGHRHRWLDTCILAMPRSNVTQPVGRIRREYPDKAPPVVMDVVDNDSPVFAGYATARLKWYKSIGAKSKTCRRV